MAGTIEARIEAYFDRRVRETGGETRKVVWPGRKHAPDRLAGWFSRHILVELKRPGVKPCDGQLREHERLRAMGFEVYVIDSREAVDRLIEKVLTP